MLKVIVHYFTGTGNTAHSVKIMSEQLRANGFEVKIMQVRKDVLPPEAVFDYHIFAFPVLSWSAPVMMKRYIRQMPRSKGSKTGILAINGAIIHKDKLVKGYTGQALEEVEKILRRKNYDVFLTGNASFPDNWTQVTNPCGKKETDIIFPLGNAEVRKFTEDFIEEKKLLYRCGRFNTIWSYMIAGLFGHIGRRFLGKFYIADERCTGCRLCAKSCPAGTIRMWHQKPRWNTTCEDCNRCINICPEKAIQVSLPLFLIQSVINLGLTIWAIRAVFVYLPLYSWTSKIVLVSTEILLVIAAIFFVLWVNVVPVDAFLNLLTRIPAIHRFFRISYTKKYRRYAAPDFKPLE